MSGSANIPLDRRVAGKNTMSAFETLSDTNPHDRRGEGQRRLRPLLPQLSFAANRQLLESYRLFR